MKKAIALLIILFVSVLFFAGTLTVWTSWEGEEFFEKTAKLFEEKTGNTVEILHVPKIDSKLSMAVRMGKLPDISMIKDADVKNYVKVAVNITDTDLLELGSFDDFYLTPYRYSEGFLAIPYYADVQVLFVNKRIFTELGFPLKLDSIQDIENAAPVLESAGYIPIAWDFTSPYIFYPFLAASGPFWDESGKPILNQEKVIETISEIKKLFYKGVFTRLERIEMVDGFKKQKVAMIFQGSYLARDFENAGIDFVMLPFPSFKDKNVRSLIDSKAFIIFNEEKKELAIEFLKFLYDQSINYCITYRKYPLWTVDAPSEIDNLGSIIAHGDFAFNAPGFQPMYFSVMRQTLKTIFSGALSVVDALNNAQKFVDTNWQE
ncbi:sugar ABC transporter substrate-binding protein [Kosmotoga pacifica]|uniref:ABC transporter substrate-binding protein n=1 Tax=Kosmotoga pacifica TaxID=1330330 RepID=A0A0G2Z566_9BACT|nr:extracellular solute-binding protein [Kosmotoga pacifica]AKI96697.1 hypothetical protein IX53_01400 [Kosmotoga pacifica]